MRQREGHGARTPNGDQQGQERGGGADQGARQDGARLARQAPSRARRGNKAGHAMTEGERNKRRPPQPGRHALPGHGEKATRGGVKKKTENECQDWKSPGFNLPDPSAGPSGNRKQNKYRR